jgi:hypothetical protein
VVLVLESVHFLQEIAYYFNAVFGIVLPIGIGIIVLFGLEFYTGLKASKKEGKKI